MSQEQIEFYRKACLQDPNDADTHYNLACVIVYTYGQELYADVMNTEIEAALIEAKNACATALSLAGNHGSAMILLGQIYFFEKNNEEAESWLLSGLNMDPHNQTWLTGADNLARIYMTTERVDEAIQILEKLVEIHPHYEAGHHKLNACRTFQNQSKASSPQKTTSVNPKEAKSAELVTAFQASVQEIMLGNDSPEVKAQKVQTLQAAFQENMQKLFAA